MGLEAALRNANITLMDASAYGAQNLERDTSHAQLNEGHPWMVHHVDEISGAEEVAVCRIQTLSSVPSQNPSMVIGVLGKDGRNALFLVEQGCDIEKESAIIQSLRTEVKSVLVHQLSTLLAIPRAAG